MTKTKFLFTIGIAWLLIQSINAQDYLNVVRVNQPVESFQLDNINKITFDAENIYIKTIGNSTAQTAQFSFDEIEMITFLNSFVTQNELSVQNKNSIDVFYSIMLENITVKSSSPIKQITVYNLLGRVVKETKPHSVQAEISMQKTPPGLYLVSAITANGRISKKIIKQ